MNLDDGIKAASPKEKQEEAKTFMALAEKCGYGEENLRRIFEEIGFNWNTSPLLMINNDLELYE